MYRTGYQIDHEIMRDDRDFSLVAVDEQGHRAYSGSGDIVSMRHTISVNDPNIIIGDVVTQTVTIEFAMGIWGSSAGADALDLNRGKKIRIYYWFPRSGGSGGKVPAGVFKVKDSTRNGDRLTVTARDCFYGMERPYDSTLTYPTTLNNVVQEIADQIGIPFKGLREPLRVLKGNLWEGYEYAQDVYLENILVYSEGDKIVGSKLEGYTLQKALSLCAGYYGLSAYQNREGYLDFYGPFNVGDYYPINLNRADNPDIGKQSVCINQFSYIDANGNKIILDRTSVEEDEIPYELILDNPLFWDDPDIPYQDYPEQADTICHMYIGMVYYSGKVYYRMGDPRLEVFDRAWLYDIVNNDGAPIVVSSLDYYFDGGLSVTVCSSVGDNVGNIGSSLNEQTETRGAKSSSKPTSSANSGGPMSQKIEAMQKQINELKKEIADLKRMITPKKEER